jgi:hypothetical protein
MGHLDVNCAEQVMITQAGLASRKNRFGWLVDAARLGWLVDAARPCGAQVATGRIEAAGR